VGFFATANPAEPVRTDLDNELSGALSLTICRSSFTYGVTVDARWYTREEVLKVLAHPDSTNLMHRVGDEAKVDGMDEPLFKIPPPNVPAGAMIPDWAHGRFPPR
jgi:NAD+ diphosphatase